MKHVHCNLADCVKLSLEQYFQELDGETPQHVYELVLNQIEKPLLESVLAQAQNNQSKAAFMLGLNRGTLRKKLKQHRLIE